MMFLLIKFRNNQQKYSKDLRIRIFFFNIAGANLFNTPYND